MVLTVFYSWQSDISNRINRNFIEDALKKAIQSVSKDFMVQKALRNDEIELDKDTKGVPGIPPIADVIFEKISKCAIFIPDLTFVGTSVSGRPIPNPNVLIEYGWALKEVTHSRIISVMNTAFGEPTAVNMPFDMRHLRNPITFHLKEDDTPELRSKVKAELSKSLAYAIELVIKGGALDSLMAEPKPLDETPTTDNPSTFLARDEPFATIASIRSTEQKIFLPAVERIFLRLIPTTRIDEIKSSKAAYDLARSGQLAPMSHEVPGDVYGRNKYGAFVCIYSSDQIISLTQLFKNGELWGIEADCIEKKIHMERANVSFGFFPCISFEHAFLLTLTNYLKFASEKLKLPLPLLFIAGATDVEGYKMTAPNDMTFGGFERFAGNVVNRHIIYKGQVNDYNNEVTKILRPFFDHVWEECGLERPNRERLR